MNKAAPALLLCLALSACGTTRPDVPSTPGMSELPRPAPTEAASRVVVVHDLSAPLPVGETLHFAGRSTSPTPTLLHLDGQPYQEVPNDTVTAQAVKVVRTEWIQKGPWTKQLNSAPREVCRPPRSFTVTVSGSYTLNISGSGDIAVVKVTAGLTGSMTLTAGITYSWTACSYYQRRDIERYMRYELWAFYSNGTSKWTGGISNIRQKAQQGDVSDIRISQWQVR